jgi:plasmid maintenance system antidote protein VapI
MSAIPARLRFHVLHRDNFTCRYCGRSPPEVVLHIDHVLAASKGGGTSASNLVTSCSACNMGKGAGDIDSVSILSSAVETAAIVRRPANASDESVRACRSEVDAIRASMALSGLTIRSLAARMGVSKTLIDAISKGQRGLTDRRTTAFCNATGTNLVRQYRDMDRALREAAGRSKERDRIAAMVAPTERAWEAA